MRPTRYERLPATIHAAVAARPLVRFAEVQPIASRCRFPREKGAWVQAIGFTTAALCAGLATLGAAPAAPAIASANAAAVAGTWFATDLGPGGHAGGNLLSGGAASGSGELAFPTPNGQFTAHVQAVGWSPLSPATDGVIVNDSAGDTFCFVLPVTKGAPSHDIGVSFSSDCSLASPAPGAAGKVNPIP